MPLSNAERQRRYIQRLKARAVVGGARAFVDPVIGVLWGHSFPMLAFRQGLADAGFVVDKSFVVGNVMVELREAGLLSQLRALANGLVQRQVNVIFTAHSLGPIRAAVTGGGLI
jgi:hypothetical protein